MHQGETRREPEGRVIIEAIIDKEDIERFASPINDYREFLYGMIEECREKLEKERDYAIRHAEYGDFASIIPADLVKRRVELETYTAAYNELEDCIKNGRKPEGENE